MSSTVLITYVVESPWTVYGPYPMTERVHDTRTRGEGGVTLVLLFFCKFARRIILARNLLRPSQGLIPGPGLAPGIAEYWEGEFHGSCRSMTLANAIGPPS